MTLKDFLGCPHILPVCHPLVINILTQPGPAKSYVVVACGCRVAPHHRHHRTSTALAFWAVRPRAGSLGSAHPETVGVDGNLKMWQQIFTKNMRLLVVLKCYIYCIYHTNKKNAEHGGILAGRYLKCFLSTHLSSWGGELHGQHPSKPFI